MASNLGRAHFQSIRALFEAGTVGGLTDRQLLERFTNRDGDGAELAFASLVERHGPMVLRVCRTVLRDTHAAETVRLALTHGATRALAIRTVPVAVRKLAKGAIRTMFVNKVVTTGMAALVAAGLIATMEQRLCPGRLARSCNTSKSSFLVPAGRLMRPIESMLQRGSPRFTHDASGPCMAA